MSFIYDPTTDRGKCRLLVFDTTDGTQGIDYVFSDADIDAALEINSDSVWYASADLCRAMAAKLASSSFNLELVGALKLDRRDTAKYWMTLASTYEGRAGMSSDNIVEFIDSFDIDIDVLGQDKGEYVGDL